MSNEPERDVLPDDLPDVPPEEVPAAEPPIDDAFLDHLFFPSELEPEQEEPEAEPSRFARLLAVLRAKRRMLLLALAALGIVVLACLLVVDGAPLRDRITRVLRYSGSSAELTFDASSSNAYCAFQGGLAVASANSLQCFAADGTQTVLVQNPMDVPVLLQNGSTVLSYGIGGSSLCTAHQTRGAQLSLTVPGQLIDADLSARAYLCHSSSQTGYKTVLTVLDPAGVQTYCWYSSTQFFSQCAISDKGDTLAAIALGLGDAGYESTAVLFATDREEPVAQLPLGTDLIYDLRFLDPGRLCAVGETSLHFFDSDGAHASEFTYEGASLLAFDLHGDGFAAVVRNTNQTGGRYSLTTVASNGRALASLTFDEPVIDLSANGDYVAVLTAGRLRVYDSRLHLRLSDDNAGFATRVCVQPDGAALLIDGNHARRVS